VSRWSLPLAMLALCAAALIASTTPASADRGQVLGIEDFVVPDWFNDSFLEIAEDAAEAGDAGKHLLMFFHLAQCPYCNQLLSENFLSGPNESFIRDHFNSIEINVKGSREIVFDADTSMEERDLAKAMRVLHTPVIVFADAANNKVLRLDGYRDPSAFRTALEYVQTGSYARTSFSEYRRSADDRAGANYAFRKHPAFTSADNLQELAQMPLAIVFENPGCTSCDEVHDNLFAREDVSQALSSLRVVRLDTSSDRKIVGPDGAQTTPRALADSLGISWQPGVVLFDRGQMRATMNNRLFSWHFNGFITWVSGRHYDTTPYVFDYIDALRDKKLAKGEDVNLVDKPLKALAN